MSVPKRAAKSVLRIHTENLNPPTLTTPQPNAPIHGRDLGFLIRDMIEDRAFETFSHCALDGHYTSNGASRVTRVDSHDPNNLKIEIENGQKFTVRIFAS